MVFIYSFVFTCFSSATLGAEASLGVTIGKGYYPSRQFQTATATGALDATQQRHEGGNIKTKQEAKSAAAAASVAPENDETLCSGTAGDTWASLQERLGMTNAQATALRAQLVDDGNNINPHRKPGEQVQLFVKGGMMTEPCWRRLTGEKSESRASLAWYLLEELDANPAKVRALVVRNPATMLGKSSAAVEQVSRWLSEALEFDKAQISQFLLKFPEAGHCSVEANFVPKCRWLCDNLATDYKGVARMLKSVPSVSFKPNRVSTAAPHLGQFFLQQ